MQSGIDEAVGIDGEWVPRQYLCIPEQCFQVADLTKPLILNRKFDLVVSLEVAEHLPLIHAQTFVESLISLGPVILFSAAIPKQGGPGHVNEQWTEYWINLFSQYNYEPIDVLRRQIWDNKDVCWWFRQNIMIFASSEFVQSNQQFLDAKKQTNLAQLSLVHPENYLMKCEKVINLNKEIEEILAFNNPKISLKKTLLSLPTLIGDRLKKRLINKRS